MAKGISGVKIPKVGPNPIGIGSPKKNIIKEKSQADTIIYLQLQDEYDQHLINDYQMIHDSFPHSFTIDWNSHRSSYDIITSYTQLLSLTQELLHIVNLIGLEPLDAIFIQSRMEDPEDKDLDILVNKMKTLIFKRQNELDKILHALEHDYIDSNAVCNPSFFKSKQQIGNPINRTLKEIHQEIALLVKIFAQAQKE